MCGIKVKMRRWNSHPFSLVLFVLLSFLSGNTRSCSGKFFLRSKSYVIDRKFNTPTFFIFIYIGLIRFNLGDLLKKKKKLGGCLFGLKSLELCITTKKLRQRKIARQRYVSDSAPFGIILEAQWEPCVVFNNRKNYILPICNLS